MQPKFKTSCKLCWSMFNPFLAVLYFQRFSDVFSWYRKGPLTSNMLACGYKRIAIAIKITKLLVKQKHVTSLEFCNIVFQYNIRKWLWFRGPSIKYIRWEGGWPKAHVGCFSDLILLLESSWRCLNEHFKYKNCIMFSWRIMKGQELNLQ